MARVDDSLSLENSYSLIQRNVLSLTTSAPQQQYVSICGRKSETHTLLKVYQRFLETKQAQTVVIHGESGSGKTALANTLRSPVFKTGGYFVEGKYHQRNVTVQEPYSAIMVALSSLCDILVRCVDFDESKRRELKKALGSDATLLVKFISNLQPLIGEFQDIETEPISFAKFKVACKLFFRAVASMGHPIVMFLDDIQWMDEESTRLIRVFLQDKKLTNVIFVLAYRDEDAVQVFETGVLDCIRYQANIAVPNLDTATVAEIVSSNLGSTPCDQMRRLIDLAVNVTFNNPLRLTLFLETIQEEELLIYDNEEQAWIFNFDEIFQRAMASESTSELLKRKVNQLSEDLKDILKVASLLGHHFGEAVLLPVACTVIEKRRLLVSNAGLAMPGGTPSHSSVLMLLTDAVGEGLLMNTSQGFTFTHDEVQSACRSLYTASEKSSLHQLIGDAFLAQQKDDQLSIFRAAVHMNCVPASFLHGNDQQQRAKIARLNLEAAKYCETICAFDKTIIMLRTGLDILRPLEKWSAGNFTLTFEMMEALARTELMVGNFEACNQTTTEALSRGETALMNANLLLIQAEVQMLMGGHEVDKTLATATRTLRVFGVKVPCKPWFHLFVAKRLKVKYMLRGKTDEDLLSLPCADDPLAAYAVKLLMHVCTYCLMKGETSAAIFYALLALELTLKKGLSQQSPCGFVLYGIVEASLGNIDQGYRFGKLACHMLDRIDSRATECPTVTYACTMLLFRKEEFHALVAPLYEAATSGLQYGRSFRYNEYALAGSYRMHFQMDTHLESIEDSMRLWYGNVSDLGQDEQLMWIQPIFQYILNMRADVDSWGDISILTGEIMNEEEFFQQATNTNDELHKLMGLFWKIKLAIDFGQVSLAASIMENLKSYDVKGMRILSMGPSYFFDRARVSYGLFRLWGQRRHLREARKDRRELQRMNDAGCPSALPLLSFLAAREDTLRKNYVDVSTQRAAYKRGIDFLVESKSYSLEGLLNENAGFDFARRGLRADAQHYFDRALYIYQTKYGAKAKYNQLRQSSAKALARLQDSAAAKSPDVTRMAGDTASHISTMNS